MWVSSLSVMDGNAAVAAVNAAGGKVLWDPRRWVPAVPWSGTADPEKAPLALMRAPGGIRRRPTGDQRLALDRALEPPAGQRVQFYSRLAPYQSRPSENLDRPYFVLDTDGQPRAGIMQLFAKDVRPLWVPYVRVADVAAALKQVEALGGHVIVSPRRTPQWNGGLDPGSDRRRYRAAILGAQVMKRSRAMILAVMLALLAVSACASGNVGTSWGVSVGCRGGYLCGYGYPVTGVSVGMYGRP